MDLSLAILICLAIGFGVGIIAGWLIHERFAIHVDPKDVERLMHNPAWEKYSRPQYVEFLFWLLRIVLLIALGKLAMVVMASAGIAELIGPVCAIPAYILGEQGYNRYHHGKIIFVEHKWLEKAANILLVIYLIATLGLTIQFFLQSGSISMTEGMMLGIPFLLFWLTIPFDWLLSRPAEISMKRHIYKQLGNDPDLIRKAESMRRNPPWGKRSYRELLEYMSSTLQIKTNWRR